MSLSNTLLTALLFALLGASAKSIASPRELAVLPQNSCRERTPIIHTLSKIEIETCLTDIPLYCGVDASSLDPDEIPSILFTNRGGNLVNWGQRAQGHLETDPRGLVFLPGRKNQWQRCMKSDAWGRLFFAVGVGTQDDPCAVRPEAATENLIPCYPKVGDRLHHALKCLRLESPPCEMAPINIHRLRFLEARIMYQGISEQESREFLGVIELAGPPESAEEHPSDSEPRGSWRGVLP